MYDFLLKVMCVNFTAHEINLVDYSNTIFAAGKMIDNLWPHVMIDVDNKTFKLRFEGSHQADSDAPFHWARYSAPPHVYLIFFDKTSDMGEIYKRINVFLPKDDSRPRTSVIFVAIDKSKLFISCRNVHKFDLNLNNIPSIEELYNFICETHLKLIN